MVNLSKLLIICIFLISCGLTNKITYSNFLKVKEGMTREEVIDILGEPTKVTSGNVDIGIGSILGIDKLSGTTMLWTTGDAKINILFFKDKVKSYNYTNQF